MTTTGRPSGTGLCDAGTQQLAVEPDTGQYGQSAGRSDDQGCERRYQLHECFSIQKAVDHFDTEQMKKWCSRLYNKSGIFKYVYPFLNEMPVGADGAKQTYPQIYGLKGSLKAHRNYFIQRRYDLKQVEYGYVSTLAPSSTRVRHRWTRLIS